MATRREAREWVVQLLFQVDLNPVDDLEKVFEHFWADGNRAPDQKARQFAQDEVRGVLQNIEAVDAAVRRYAENWSMKRMRTIDRNVLRMAMYEMLFRYDIPPVVSINEAIDIAKYFGSRESGKFINGILDRARKDLDRPPRTAGMSPSHAPPGEEQGGIGTGRPLKTERAAESGAEPHDQPG